MLNEPKGYRSLLGKLPTGVSVANEKTGIVDLIQFFVTSKKALEEELPGLKECLKLNGLLWVTYPKGGSEIKSDINRDVILEYAKTVGLQAVSIISIDESWSALRLKSV